LHVQGADGSHMVLALEHFGLAQPALNVRPTVGLRRYRGAAARVSPNAAK
jgi:hypothetical protein